MKIVDNKLKYIEQLVGVVEEYREFCGFSRSPERTALFFRRLLKKKESSTFLAVDEQSDEVMGFVNLYPSYSTLSLKRLWILNDLGVAKCYQGQGVASFLIQKAVSFAKSTDAVRIELKTQKSNGNAQKLYKSLGFSVDGENIYYTVPL